MCELQRKAEDTEVEGTGRKCGIKEGRRCVFEMDKGKEERGLQMKIRKKSFPIEFSRAFYGSTQTIWGLQFSD
jgi:hypothetical protein